MSVHVAAEVCDHCGVADGAIGNWTDGQWQGLAALFRAPKVVLPVPVLVIRLRQINGQRLCPRCVGRVECK